MRFIAAPSDSPIALAQQLRVEALMRGAPTWAGPLVASAGFTRFRIVDGDRHRYDAWAAGGGVPLVVFAPDGDQLLGWWSDQDEDTEQLADRDAVYAAFELLVE